MVCVEPGNADSVTVVIEKLDGVGCAIIVDFNHCAPVANVQISILEQILLRDVNDELT